MQWHNPLILKGKKKSLFINVNFYFYLKEQFGKYVVCYWIHLIHSPQPTGGLTGLSEACLKCLFSSFFRHAIQTNETSPYINGLHIAYIILFFSSCSLSKSNASWVILWRQNCPVENGLWKSLNELFLANPIYNRSYSIIPL